MSFRYKNDEAVWCILATLSALFIRLCISLHSYSGANKSPMYGDYEAQRHWMEITVNLPMNQWYHHNDSVNDLNYWGLDYPPLTAYHSYVNGLVAYSLNPDYVKLVESKGYESEMHKLFMRYTVLISDLLFYIPFAIGHCIFTYVNCKKRTPTLPLRATIMLTLFYPGLILIDHGHFQYNCVSLGLTVGAILFIGLKYDIAASVLFVLALNYKQMELYHGFPFFLYLLSACIPKPGASASSGIWKFTKLSITVLVTFAILWMPFLFTVKDFLQVVHRLFPLSRGLFEDKVANVWCTLNIFYKFKNVCVEKMLRYCTIATLSALLPTSADLFLRPNIEKFVPAIINSSLAFFLFSYQVHEKSILLAAVPVLLYLPNRPLACFWFLLTSTFSLLPLLIRDRLSVAYVALTVFYAVIFAFCYEKWCIGDELSKLEVNLKKFYTDVRNVLVNRKLPNSYVFNLVFKYFIRDAECLKILVKLFSLIASILVSVCLTVVILVFDAPNQYPDLFTLIISSFCCLHFIGFFVYFNIVQFAIPQCFDCIESIPTKAKQS